MTTDSCRCERDAHKLRITLAMFKTVCQNTQRESLSFSNGFIRGLPIREDSWKLDHFRHPTAIILSLILNREGHTLPQANPITRRDGRAS